MSASIVGVVVSPQIDTKAQGSLFGLEYLSDAQVLAVSSAARLVWQKGGLCWNGVGAPRTPVPCCLSLRLYAWVDGRPRMASDTALIEGGRLSTKRLLTVQPAIDEQFGAGATTQLAPGRTVLFSADSVGDWVAKTLAEPIPRTTREQAFLAACQNCTGSY